MTTALGWAGTAAIIFAGWRASPRPRSFRALVAELGWIASFDAYAWRLRRAMLDSAARLTAAMADKDEKLIAEAHRRGRDRAFELIANSLSAARQRLRESAAKLAPDVAEEAHRRLGLVASALGRSA